MKSISLAAAVTLTGWSERTFWRRFTKGGIRYEIRDGKSMIPFESIATHIQISLDADDFPVIANADAGDAEAQNDLALLFLANEQAKAAVYWLNLSAKQGYANAMQELGRCYVEGRGVARDANLGIMWIARAASCGHVISQGQMTVLCDRFVEKNL